MSLKTLLLIIVFFLRIIYFMKGVRTVDNKQFVEVELIEKIANEMACDNGCQRASGSPTGG